MSVKLAHAGRTQRALYPPSCAINPACTVAVVSTVAGTRAYALADASAPRAGPSVQPLHPTPPTAASSTMPGTASAAAPAPVTTTTTTGLPSALWHTPVYTATIADDSALVAVVFRARPQVFAPTTLSMREGAPETEPATGPPSPGASATEFAAHGDEEDEEAGPCASPPPPAEPVSSAALAAAEIECRRYVYLFEATTGTCLAALHFSGSPVLTLRANAAVLLVAAVDLFHLVDLRTLRYVRQHSMYKPLNPRGVLDLSAVVAPRGQGSRAAGAYALAFPQSARGYKGDVTVLRLHSPGALPASTTTTTSAGAAGRESGLPSAAPGSTAHAPSTQQRTIPAHHHAIAQLRFRHDGQLLATASELGTTVKLFDCATGAQLLELQRGHRPVSVLSLAVQHDGHRIAALSANGTLHVFDCGAVVRAWEARAAAAPAASSTSPSSPSAAGGAAVGKLRAECRYKVTLLPSSDTGATGRADERGADAATAAAGRVHAESGFTKDSRAVWVAQVESTEAQRQRETAALAQTPALVSSAASSFDVGARSVRLCVGCLARFPLPPPAAPDRGVGRSSGANPSAAPERGEEVCHYVVV